MERPNTPGLVGYVIAWAVSVVTFGYLMAGTLSLVTDGGGAPEVVKIGLLLSVFSAICSTPFALVGIPLVHFACRRRGSQGTHVAAAAAAGLLPAVLFLATGGPCAVGFFVVLPLSTAIGRWSVVPLVTRRRRALGAA